MPKQSDPNSNQPAGMQFPSASIFPQSDLPPLPPDFQNVPQGNPATASTNQSFNQPVGLPPNPITPPGAPLTFAASPKKKFGGKRVIATILGIFLLVGAVSAGVILTGQRQLLQQQAATPTPPPPVTVSPPGGRLACSSTGSSDVTFKWNSVTGATHYLLRIDDTSNGWVACGGKSNTGDFCISDITGTTGATTYKKTLPSNKTYKWWVSGFTSAGVQGAQSSQVQFSIPVCVGPPKPPTPTPKAPTPPTPTPKPAPKPPASCSAIKAYSSTWQALSATQLSALNTGDSPYFCFPNFPTNSAYKVVFKVNDEVQSATQVLRPNTTDTCTPYVIPTGTADFKVEGTVVAK